MNYQNAVDGETVSRGGMPSVMASTVTNQYRQALRWVCELTHVPDSVVSDVLEKEAIVIDDVVTGFRCSESDSSVLVYVELSDSHLSDSEKARLLLEKQTLLPAPFPLIFCIPPNTRRYVLRTYADIPSSREDAQRFVDLVRLTVAMSKEVWP